MQTQAAPQTINRYFSDYASHHLTFSNQICHFIGIPLIAFSLLGILSSYSWICAWTLILVAEIWYLYLDWKLAVPFAGIALGLYWVGLSFSTPVLWSVFVLGWGIQFIGHSYFEKNHPAFFKNFEHLLIGPLWIFAKITKYNTH